MGMNAPRIPVYALVFSRSRNLLAARRCHTQHVKARNKMRESGTVEAVDGLDTVDTLRERVRRLEADNTAMRAIVLRMAEARMCRDTVTMIESCPHCSLKRGGEYGYSGKHDENCVVSQARQLGF